MNMAYSDIQLTDLPDEILMTIFKQLYGVEILYSLIGVNRRLNKIAHDPIFTSVLTLLNYRLDGSICSLSYSMYQRLCFEILPKIHHKIEWLNLESASMEWILRSANYPNLYGLGLYSLEVERANYLFTDGTSILRFKNQISSLAIDITRNNNPYSRKMIRLIFTLICVMFTKLQYLNFCPSLYSRQSLSWSQSLSPNQQLSFTVSPPSAFSSTLLELHVSLDGFIDCLYLLDGRFSQLHTLYIHITFIALDRPFNNQVKLPNLKCFALYGDGDVDTRRYDDLIVPLLHRMTNLEKLDLQFICKREKFVDGDDLKRNIVNHLLRLNTFTFNIRSINYRADKTGLPSNEDIQQTFKDFKYGQVLSCVDYFEKSLLNQCYVYSYPYKSKYYRKITNNFPSGLLFECVRIVSLWDERPFEHEFFLRIAQSFPFMKKLSVINCAAQKNKQCRKSENENLSIIEYHHLIELTLIDVHEDYLEEFLFNTKTYLPNGVDLFIRYGPLKKVTHNFERDATRINCSKIKYSYAVDFTQVPKHFKDYFLNTDVASV